LTIDPLTQGTGNFDFEGVAGREVKLVEAGVLRDGFYDLEYAKKCGTRASGLATGNLRDRFQTEPIRIPRGSERLDALIQDAGRGILIQHCSEMSRTTNLRGDFSCGLDALLFEDGQIRGRIKNLNMSGKRVHVVERWLDLDERRGRIVADAWGHCAAPADRGHPLHRVEPTAGVPHSVPS
jgi:predicted Zn-dependent protease